MPSDFLALITIRKLFASIANTFSPSKLSATALTLVLISAVVTGLPLALIALVDKHPLAILGDPNATKRDLFLFTICIFNVSTALLCVAVAIFLFTALAHKIVWPVLSRLFYPLASKKILTNKKILIPAGTLALTFAFGLDGRRKGNPQAICFITSPPGDLRKRNIIAHCCCQWL